MFLQNFSVLFATGLRARKTTNDSVRATTPSNTPTRIGFLFRFISFSHDPSCNVSRLNRSLLLSKSLGLIRYAVELVRYPNPQVSAHHAPRMEVTVAGAENMPRQSFPYTSPYQPGKRGSAERMHLTHEARRIKLHAPRS